jgi:hypothetical protein
MIMMFVGPKCFSIEDPDGLGVDFNYSQNWNKKLKLVKKGILLSNRMF